ncbi:MAG: response regulator transcription factor [Actinomycetota bacterium]|nr:response regulator transcription factor [Actinomycetota bacterium]
MPKARVLVVEDDVAVQRLLVALLRHDGHEVRAVGDGLEAIAVALSFRPDLAMIDGGLPGLDGRSVARRLRQAQEVAILFVTGATSSEDRREGFRAGGDDYVCKPFDPEELSLRVRAILRRTGVVSEDVLHLGEDDVVIEGGARRVTRRGAEIMLTEKEYLILLILARRRGTVVARRQLVAELWGYDDDAGDHSLEVHVSALRRKLEAHGARIIHTVRGIGYILRVDPE